MKIAHHGPYRLFRHPNYIAVAVELISLPLIFGAYVTAALAAAANGLLILARIRSEVALLRKFTSYGEIFPQKI
jgi:methyltransferase